MSMKRVAGMVAAVAVANAALAASVPGTNDAVRIASFNICHGAPSYNADVNLEKTAQTIAELNADFVCLQEVDNETTRSGSVDETAYLAQATGLTGTFAKAIAYGGGEFGVAILSKERPLSVETVELPDPANSEDTYYHENRVLLVCEFTNCIVATTHLPTSPTVRLSHLETITNRLAACTKPVFLTGDWNALPSSETLAAANGFFDILSPTSSVVTLNTKLPKLSDYCIDYIAVRKTDGDGWFVRYSQVIEERDTSDHAPILVEVLLVPSPLDWVSESAATTELTGTWSKPVAYDRVTLTAPLRGYSTFTPGVASSGNVVTAKVAVAFSELVTAEDLPAGAQAALRLGANNVFQAWTDDVWLDVAADGVTPRTNAEYTISFAVDYRTRRYSAFVEMEGESRPLAAVDGGRTAFALAGNGTAVSAIEFMGDGVLSSILGECAAIEDFAADEAVVVKDAAPVILTAAQAAWLNNCSGGRDALAASAAKLTADDFAKAYLLNLDISRENSYSFRLTSIDLDPAANKVTIGVTLTRTGSLAQSTNGRLVFYGTDSVSKFTGGALEPLGGVTLTDDDFSDGDKAAAEILLSGETPPVFFRAKIDER